MKSRRQWTWQVVWLAFLLAANVMACGDDAGTGKSDEDAGVKPVDAQFQEPDADMDASADSDRDAQQSADCIDGSATANDYDLTEDTTFLVGPAVLNVTDNSIEVMWEPDGDCDGTLYYGQVMNDLSQEVTSQVTDGVHHATIDGLVPGTRYYYRVSSCGQTSRVLATSTAPSSNTSVRFTVWGDSRSDPEECGRVVDAMAAVQPAFTINSGDIVADGRRWQQYKDQFFDPLRALGHHVPTFVAIGNHEREGDGFFAYLDIQTPPEASDPRAFGGTYAFTFGNVYVLVIDTTLPELEQVAQGTESDVSRWIEQAVSSSEAQQARWRIAVGHYPAWSESWTPGFCSQYDGTAWVAEWLMPLLADNGFQVYFAGHTHDYERGEYRGVVHIITGGGGAALDDWCRDLPEIDVYALEHHFVQVDAGCDELVLQAISVPDNEVIDQVVLNAQ